MMPDFEILVFTGLGVPGHPGTGAVGHAMAVQRRDLGTIPGHAAPNSRRKGGPRDNRVEYPPSAATNSSNTLSELPRSDSFVGSITSYFFGRKGGLL